MYAPCLRRPGSSSRPDEPAGRRHLLAPVAVFVYLILVLLDLERLRAELLRRALFLLLSRLVSAGTAGT